MLKFLSFPAVLCLVLIVFAMPFYLFGASARTALYIAAAWFVSAILVALPVCAYLRRHNNSFPPVYRIVYKK